MRVQTAAGAEEAARDTRWSWDVGEITVSQTRWKPQQSRTHAVLHKHHRWVTRHRCFEFVGSCRMFGLSLIKLCRESPHTVYRNTEICCYVVGVAIMGWLRRAACGGAWWPVKQWVNPEIRDKGGETKEVEDEEFHLRLCSWRWRSLSWGLPAESGAWLDADQLEWRKTVISVHSWIVF